LFFHGFVVTSLKLVVEKKSLHHFGGLNSGKTWVNKFSKFTSDFKPKHIRESL